MVGVNYPRLCSRSHSFITSSRDAWSTERDYNIPRFQRHQPSSLLVASPSNLLARPKRILNNLWPLILDGGESDNFWRMDSDVLRTFQDGLKQLKNQSRFDLVRF